MTVTLGDLLRCAELGLRLVDESSPERADDVRIRWAHGIELIDPRRFLQGDEMVMLTGLRLPRRPDDQVRYVDRLVEVHVAVLGFGTGVRFASIPAAIVKRCRQVGLPLVEIPLGTPFMAVSQEIARAESAQQTAPLHDLIELQQSLSRAAVRGGIPGLTRQVHRSLGALTVLDEEGAVLASDAPEWFVAQAVAFVRAHRGRSAAGTTVLAPQPDSGCALVEVHALTGRRSRAGWLAIGPSRPPRPTDRLLINQIVSLAALSLDGGDLPARDRLETIALSALLRRDPADPEALDLADLCGVSVQGDVVMLCLAGPAAQVATGGAHQLLESDGVVHLCRADRAETLVLVRADEAEHAVRLIGERIRRAEGPSLSLGVSAPLPARHAARGVEPARRSAASAARRRQPVGRVDELSIESLLSEPALREQVLRHTEPVFAALAAATPTRDGDLATVLQVFLRHNGRWGPAAAELGVHRHTLYSRIDRVQQLTGIDLDDAHQRALLLLASTARG